MHFISIYYWKCIFLIQINRIYDLFLRFKIIFRLIYFFNIFMFCIWILNLLIYIHFLYLIYWIRFWWCIFLCFIFIYWFIWWLNFIFGGMQIFMLVLILNWGIIFFLFFWFIGFICWFFMDRFFTLWNILMRVSKIKTKRPLFLRFILMECKYPWTRWSRSWLFLRRSKLKSLRNYLLPKKLT